MSRIQLVVVLSIPFLFAALPLISLAFAPGEGVGGGPAGTVTIVVSEVAEDPGDTEAQFHLQANSAAESPAEAAALAYRTGTEVELDCSLRSNPHIDG
ncbi:MAG: hypothetical protein M0R74_03205 [Dehalococcoidia bacterium]|nr:hypothetical protein [Dehalococcoidia bacterium]